jgi:hypothetical protein
MSIPRELHRLVGEADDRADKGRREVLWAGAGLLLSRSVVRASSATPTRSEPNRGVSSALGESAHQADLCSSANAIGVGLRGEYFSADGWRGHPNAVRTDTTVNFASPAELSKACGLQLIGSVRWTGWVRAHVSGRFRFEGGSPQVRVVVSNLDQSGPQVTSTAGIQLSAGRYYPVRVELDRVSTAQKIVRLQWTAPYGARYVIPRELLFLPSDTVRTL